MRPPIFDAHFHVIDPRFPLVRNQGFLPEPYTCDDYLRDAGPLGIVGGAVVSGSFQAFDQTYLLDALARLGPAFVGVTQLPQEVSDAEIARLHAAGVRAVRFNVLRGGSAAIDALEGLAARVFAIAGWHVELYVDARTLADLVPRLLRLPRAVVDHLGLSAAGLPSLLELVEHGVSVKASGFGRVDFDVPDVLRRLAAANPDALVFGTDLPSTRAPVPFRPSDIDLVVDALGDEVAGKVLLHNARALYRPAGHP
jgi:predicted TIM-barrel fold metal-dependent hydrolase